MSEYQTSVKQNQSSSLQMNQSSNKSKIQEYQSNFNTNETLQYLNQFLKKETWSQIANTINERGNITTLKLSGVNIDGNGLRNLGDILRLNNQIRNLIIEWNYLFNYIEEFDYFCNCIATSGIVFLSLNNNRINAPLCRSIQTLIKNSKKLMYLDLKWNEIGNEGAKQILAGLGINTSIIEINLIGNKINDTTLKEVNEFVLKAKQGMIFKYNPADDLGDELLKKTKFKGKDSLIENIESTMPLKIIEKEKAISNEFKARYDIQLIQNAKLEKENKEFEKRLEEEQIKVDEMKEDYDHAVNIEKTNRVKAEELSLYLKNQLSKMTMEKEQLENELEAKTEQYAKEKANFQLTIKSQKETTERNANGYEEKIQRLKSEYEKINNNLSTSIAGLSNDNENIKKEYLEQNKNSIEAYEQKVKAFDIQIKQLRNEKDQFENDLSEEKKFSLENKMQLEHIYKSREARLLNDEHSKFNIINQNLEKRIQMLEETNNEIDSKCKSFIKELEKSKEANNSEYLACQSKINELSSINEGLKTKNSSLKAENSKMQIELKSKENQIEKLNVQIVDLNKYKETLIKNNDSYLIKKETSFIKEKEALENERNILRDKIKDLEYNNELLKSKISQYSTDLPRLSEKLKNSMISYIDNN